MLPPGFVPFSTPIQSTPTQWAPGTYLPPAGPSSSTSCCCTSYGPCPSCPLNHVSLSSRPGNANLTPNLQYDSTYQDGSKKSVWECFKSRLGWGQPSESRSGPQSHPSPPGRHKISDKSPKCFRFTQDVPSEYGVVASLKSMGCNCDFSSKRRKDGWYEITVSHIESCLQLGPFA